MRRCAHFANKIYAHSTQCIDAQLQCAAMRHAWGVVNVAAKGCCSRRMQLGKMHIGTHVAAHPHTEPFEIFFQLLRLQHPRESSHA